MVKHGKRFKSQKISNKFLKSIIASALFFFYTPAYAEDNISAAGNEIEETAEADSEEETDEIIEDNTAETDSMQNSEEQQKC